MMRIPPDPDPDPKHWLTQYPVPYLIFFRAEYHQNYKTMHLCTQDQVVFSTAILAAVAHGLYALSLLPQGEETRSQYQASGCGVTQFTAR